jgi:peptidoglycan hydrolase CwlO-like protein
MTDDDNTDAGVDATTAAMAELFHDDDEQDAPPPAPVAPPSPPPPPALDQVLMAYVNADCMRLATSITGAQGAIKEHLDEIRKMYEQIKLREEQVNQLKTRIVHFQGSVLALREVEKRIQENTHGHV